MELDQYGFTLPATESHSGDPERRQKIHHWRGRFDLHGWMQALHIRKGGQRDMYCSTVMLDSADLDQLEQDVESQGLPNYGPQPEDAQESDRDFIFHARAEIAIGRSVYYTADW